MSVTERKLYIPDEILEEKNYSTMILFVLGFHGTQRPAIFFDKNKLMNINTFYAHVKKLKEKNFVSVKKNSRMSEYEITQEGRTELNRRLKNYTNLDFKSVISLEQERIGNFIDSFLIFFRKYEIEDDEIEIEYLQLANEITRDKFQTFNQAEFDKLLLFFAFNHPKFYPMHTVTKEEFIDFINRKSEEKLTLTDLNYFLQQVVEKEVYGIKFYKLESNSDGRVVYFRSNSEYGTYFETSIKSHLKRNYYSKNLRKRDFNFTATELEDLKQSVLTFLVHTRLFNWSLESSIKILIEEYLESIDKKIKETHPGEIPDWETDLIPFLTAFELTNVTNDDESLVDLKMEEKSPIIGSEMDAEMDRFGETLMFLDKLTELDGFNEAINILDKKIADFSLKFTEPLKVPDFFRKQAKKFQLMEDYEKFLALFDVATNYMTSEPYDTLNSKQKRIRESLKKYLESR